MYIFVYLFPRLLKSFCTTLIGYHYNVSRRYLFTRNRRHRYRAGKGNNADNNEDNSEGIKRLKVTEDDNEDLEAESPLETIAKYMKPNGSVASEISQKFAEFLNAELDIIDRVCIKTFGENFDKILFHIFCNLINPIFNKK